MSLLGVHPYVELHNVILTAWPARLVETIRMDKHSPFDINSLSLPEIMVFPFSVHSFLGRFVSTFESASWLLFLTFECWTWTHFLAEPWPFATNKYVAVNGHLHN